MPRGPRLDAPGAAHHVMVRGIERRRIFVDATDYAGLVARLDRVLPESGARCLAWVFMPNHVHLVVQTGAIPLSRIMARINTGHAAGFNRRHDRAGFLFQNRFKSRMVIDDADLRGLIRYVHRNPLDHGIVPDLEHLAQFPWCGHGALVGARDSRSFESIGPALALFGATVAQSRAGLIAWMEVGRGAGAPETASIEDGLNAVDAPTTEACPDADVVAAICERMGIEPRAVAPGSLARSHVRARAVVAYVGVDCLGLSNMAMARALGVSEASASRYVRRGRTLVERGELGAVPLIRDER